MLKVYEENNNERRYEYKIYSEHTDGTKSECVQREHIKRCVKKFDKGILEREFCFTVPAFSSKHDITENGDIIIKPDGCSAG